MKLTLRKGVERMEEGGGAEMVKGQKMVDRQKEVAYPSSRLSKLSQEHHCLLHSGPSTRLCSPVETPVL